MSIPSAAVAVASEYLGDLDGARVLVIGAGQMGSGLASTLRSRGVAEVVVANRTLERAEQLAADDRRRRRSRSTDIADTLVDTDVLLTSTASSEVLVERAMVEMVMACRDGKPLLVVDVALPRDVDPGVGDIPDVTLLDLDDLKEYAQRSAERRRGEIGKVRAILAAEIERYRAERAAREVGPLVTSLRELAEDVRRGELERFRAKLAKLDPDARDLVDAITQGHRQQAVARAHGAREGRGGNAARRLLRRRARLALRSPDRADGRIRVIRIATRASALARWQAERVGALLGRDVEFVLVTTTGDRDQTSDLHAIGGQGVFTKEVQQAVLDGRADVAVHSAKDLPTATPPGSCSRRFPNGPIRATRSSAARSPDLVPGARIGTGSVRRRAQLAAARPDLTFGPLRGNIETRLRKRDELGYDAVVVAYAALERLGLADAKRPRCSTRR